MRGLRAAFLIVLVAACVVGLFALPAGAHALLKRSAPAAGASLSRSPQSILLDFTEAPEPSLSTVSVLDSSGKTVPGVGKPTPVPGKPQQLRVEPVPRLQDGVYTVNWRTVSKVDGHVTAGSFAFGIGVPLPAGASATGATTGGLSSTSSTPTPAAVAGRWLLYWGLALLVAAGASGTLVFEWRLPPGGGIVIAAGWVLAAAGILTLILSARVTVGVPLRGLFHLATGRSLVAQAIAVAACGMAALFAIVHPAGPRLAVMGAAAAAAMFVHAQAGHAEAHSSVRLLNVADQWMHMLAVGVWVGGLVWLLLGLRALSGPDRASAVGRFSQVAFVAVVLIAATGVLRAVPEVGSLAALASTSFGVALLIKTGLFAALMAVAWRNRYRLVPRVAGPHAPGPADGPPPDMPNAAGAPAAHETTVDSQPSRADELTTGGTPTTGASSLRRSVTVEVALAAVVLVVTAVLTELPPANFVTAAGQRAPAVPSSVTVTGSDFATTVRARFTASPGTVGPNRFQVQVLRYDSGRPVAARAVRVEFSLPSNPNVTSSLDLSRGSDGTWTGQGTNLSIEGRWDVNVVVQEAATAVNVPLRLRTRLPPEQITVSTVPGQPTVYTIQLGSGLSLQTYVDPGKRGANTVHYTFFQASGDEASITSPEATAITPGGEDRPLSLIRFDKGHFAANVSLAPGRWTFRIEAVAAGGKGLSGYFSPVIES